MKQIQGGVCAAKGFTANGVHCGIRKNKTKRDLALIYSESVCSAAAVYTQNLVKGAPLTVTKNNIVDGKAQAVTDTKLEELTREVREHNNFAKRMPVVEERISVINHRIADLEGFHKGGDKWHE